MPRRPLTRVRLTLADLMANRPTVGNLTAGGVPAAVIVEDVRLPGVLTLPSPVGPLMAVNVPNRRVLVMTGLFTAATDVLATFFAREPIPQNDFTAADIEETAVYLAGVFGDPTGDDPNQARRTGLTCLERLWDAMSGPLAVPTPAVVFAWERGEPVPLGKLTRED